MRDDFFDPFVTFRREMDRMFDGFFGSGLGKAQSTWHSLTPAVDVDENEKEIIVTAELPGVTEKDVEVGLAGDILTIQGEKHSQHEPTSDRSRTGQCGSKIYCQRHRGRNP